MNKQNKKPRSDELYKAILKLETLEECKHFFDDLCTVTELQALEQRYQVATYLSKGMIYNEILEKTFAEVKLHANGADQSDDITIMCIKYC